MKYLLIILLAASVSACPTERAVKVAKKTDKVMAEMTPRQRSMKLSRTLENRRKRGKHIKQWMKRERPTRAERWSDGPK